MESSSVTTADVDIDGNDVNGSGAGAGDAVEAFVVVVSDEGRHSLWWPGRPVPAGWRVASDPGSRQECLDLIEERWSGLRTRPRLAQGDRR